MAFLQLKSAIFLITGGYKKPICFANNLFTDLILLIIEIARKKKTVFFFCNFLPRFCDDSLVFDAQWFRIATRNPIVHETAFLSFQ